MSMFHPHLYKKCNKEYSSFNSYMPRIQSYAVLLTPPWHGFVWAKVMCLRVSIFILSSSLLNSNTVNH